MLDNKESISGEKYKNFLTSMTYISLGMASTENVSTSIRIRQTPERRRKSLDETSKHTQQQQRVHSPGGIYYLQHKTASRSLDDLNVEDVIMVNGSPSSVPKITTSTVKSAAVISLTGGKERSNNNGAIIKTLNKTKEELIGDSNLSLIHI